MCIAPALNGNNLLMDWHCKDCDKSGTIEYPEGLLPSLQIELLMDSHEAASPECVYTHDKIEVSPAREALDVS